MITLEYDILTTREELNKLQYDWNTLVQRSSLKNVFLTWEWISCWWNFFGGARQPWVLTARESGSGKLLGIAPFAIEEFVSKKGLHYNILSFLGSGPPAPDHLDLIVDAEQEQAVTPALINELLSLRGQWDKLRLHGLAADSSLISQLQRKIGYRLVSKELCPYIQLPDDWATYEMALSKKLRSNTRYSVRRLEKMYEGAVSFQKVSNETELENALDNLFILHTEVQQSHGVDGAFVDQRMQGFHRCLSMQFLNKGWLRFYRLRVQEEDIALLYCFYFKGVLSYYQSGYSLKWRKYSSGSQIIAYAIQKAIEEGATKFDFLRGAHGYKYRWADQVSQNLSLEYSSTIIPRLHQIYLDTSKRVRIIQARIAHRAGV